MGANLFKIISEFYFFGDVLTIRVDIRFKEFDVRGRQGNLITKN